MAESRILLEVLKGEQVTPPPIWMMRQAGRYLPEYRKLQRSRPAAFSTSATIRTSPSR